MKSCDLSRLKVLVVDGRAPMRALLRRILRALGVRQIHDADSVDEGFLEFNRVVPDLVLVDWCPGFDGLALVKRIRTDQEIQDPQTPIIIVTTYGEARRVMQALDAGMSEYLVKPVSASQLHIRIVNAIEKARPFVRSEMYNGPCCRRRALPFAGADRRRSGVKEATAATQRDVSEAAAQAEAA